MTEQASYIDQLNDKIKILLNERITYSLGDHTLVVGIYGLEIWKKEYGNWEVLITNHISDEEDKVFSDFLHIPPKTIKNKLDWVRLTYNELVGLVNFCERLSEMKAFI